MQRTGSRSSLHGGSSWSNLYSGDLGGGHLSRSSSRGSLGGVYRSSSFSPGYLNRSASGQSLFGTAIRSSSTTTAYTPPFHSVGVQRSTPHYMDKYPFVRYSYGGNDSGFNLLRASDYARTGTGRTGRGYSSSGSGGSYSLSRYMNSALPSSALRAAASSQLPTTRSIYPHNFSHSGLTRPQISTRAQSYSAHIGLDSAVDLYKNRCMTVGTLSKYWLSSSKPSSSAFVSRRERDAAQNYVGPSYAPGSYRYFNRTTRY